MKQLSLIAILFVFLCLPFTASAQYGFGLKTCPQGMYVDDLPDPIRVPLLGVGVSKRGIVQKCYGNPGDMGMIIQSNRSQKVEETNAGDWQCQCCHGTRCYETTCPAKCMR